MTKEYLSLLQNSINFYQKSLKDWEKALSFIDTTNKYYNYIVEKMLEESDLIDKYNRMINNEKNKKL